MTTATITSGDVRLRDVIIHALDWDPAVDASAIGVTARNGVITLTGLVDTYAGKLAAEQAAKRIRGVRAVANDLVVRVKGDVTDTDIAASVVVALKVRAAPASVQASVHGGVVTLTGYVDWLDQERQAEAAVQHLAGVCSVINQIEVLPKTVARDVRRRILQALHRSAELDARGIDVAVAEDVVTLRGTVASWPEREAAERGAGSAPGIRRVDNQLVVEPREPQDLAPPEEIC